MVKAIVYISNTGFTKKYAELLSQKTGIPIYEFKEAKKKLNKNDDICYMGWIMAGKIKKYSKAKKRYNITVSCGVGMAPSKDKQIRELKNMNHINEKFFYLQGGYDKTKLKGIYKMMMNVMEEVIKSQMTGLEARQDENKEMIEILTNGKKDITESDLNGVIEFIKK